MSPSSLGWSDFLREKILDKGHVVLLTVDAFSLGAGPQRVWENFAYPKIGTQKTFLVHIFKVVPETKFPP